MEAINSLEPKYQGMSDEELRHQTDLFRERLRAGETLEDLLPEAFAVCREGGRRFLNMRHYDVQLIGGMVLHSGAIAEMVTGEGKTLVATLPAYLNALEGKGVHVVTVNDYLARRDMEWMAPLYMGLGLTVGAIQSDMSVAERQKAYACDITYGTNNEFGFDYLRDNMRPAAKGDNNYPSSLQQSQGPLHYAIIDEVDNILIDEARTPLIISGPAHENIRKYGDADRIARQLKRDIHFEVNEKDHSVTLTDEGVREAERQAGVESFYTAGNMEWPHLIDNSLKAHYLYKRDVNYVVKEGRVVIVDEFTGRLMEGRQWSDGLHQAVEAKEGVKIKEETQTLATITLQNFFKLYDKIAGMTGTAMTEANEFWKIYQLDVVAIPTNRPLQRLEHPDVIYCTEEEKFSAIADEIEQINRWDTVYLKKDIKVGTILKENSEQITFQPRGTKKTETIAKSDVVKLQPKGRPVLVGTTSIEKSERLAALLERRGVEHQILNAKQHKREAQIVAQAGRIGAVTIATNMAGRGTDIILGGNPETMAWAILQDKYATRLDVPREEWAALVEEIDQREKMTEEGERVKDLGGLHVIGTERHEARRIDLQLRGRCGRQGDPGSSRFYLSLRDDLMRIFAGEWVEKVLKSWGGWQEGDAIESPMVTRRIEAAQKKVEERNFEIRKNLLEYDEVMDEQRKRVYRYRQSILDGVNCRDLIRRMIDEQVDQDLSVMLEPLYGPESFSAWAANRLSTTFEARDFKGLDFDSAAELAIDQARDDAQTQLQDALDENLPDTEDPNDWNWESLTNVIHSRWGVKLTSRELIEVGRDRVEPFLLDKIHAAIDKVDLSEGKVFLEDTYPLKMISSWVRHKLGVELSADELVDLERAEIIDRVKGLANDVYDRKEAEYPVLAAYYSFSTRTPNGRRLDRKPLIEWASRRFDTELDYEQFRHRDSVQIREELIQLSQQQQKRANEVLEELLTRFEQLGFREEDDEHRVGDRDNVSELIAWLEDRLGTQVPKENLEDLTPLQLKRRLVMAVERRFRPEMRKMERHLLLQIVDNGWKDHLLAMDHLRSAVGLVGYAQVDPKVEYKREGMKLFEKMWGSIGQRTTDLVFRIEQLDERFVGSTWSSELTETHQEAPAPSEGSDIRSEQEQAIRDSQGEVAIETIRNQGQRVGRNDPCPCGSGKKYKNCCLRARAS